MYQSPFKFLNSYEKEDKDLFFGREEETEALYELTFDTRLILLYGGSGTGKTSLLQAGLANKFSETRWKDILIRRNDNINDAISLRLQQELEAAQGVWPKEGLSPVAAIRQIQQLTFLPIYLIFDQFEELFVLGKDAREQQAFFQFIQELLDTNVSCKVILSMREEFLAELWVFEQEVPSLFDHRFRVERMRRGQLQQVVDGTLQQLVGRSLLRVEAPQQLSADILDRLSVDESSVELAYLQVYLDRLYQLAVKDTGDEVPVFSPALVQQLGTVEDVIGDFLDDQLHELEHELAEPDRGLALQLLGTLVSDEQTKKVLHMEALEETGRGLGLSADRLHRYLSAFENMRILKRYSVKSDLKVELTHDVIAKKIWERLPEADKQLRQIKKSLQQRREDFGDGRGSLLGEKELNAWSYYFSRLDLDQETQRFVEQSQTQLTEQAKAEEERIRREKAQVEKNLRLQKRIGRGLIGLGSIIALLLALTLYVRSSLVKAQGDNVSFLLKKSKDEIRSLKYEMALSSLKTANKLKKNDREVGKGMMEMAYYFNESGETDRARGLADTLATIFKRSMDLATADLAGLRLYLQQLDPDHFENLEKRYYPEMIFVPGGKFMMGADSTITEDWFPIEVPVHEVQVSDFSLATTETTVWQYHLYTKANKLEMPETPSWSWLGDHPVCNIKWDDAAAYCNWLGELPGRNNATAFRLPLEKEWEYAARGGSENSSYTTYSGNNEIDSVAWYVGNSEAVQPVAGKQANVLGLYDLSGNVYEWCKNPYYDYPLFAPEEVGNDPFYVLRGGSYDTEAKESRVTWRRKMFSSFFTSSYGFRVAAGEE